MTFIPLFWSFNLLLSQGLSKSRRVCESAKKKKRRENLTWWGGWNEKIRVALTDTGSEKRTGVNGFTGPVCYFRKWNPQIHPSRSLSLRLRGLRLADLLGTSPDSWGRTHFGGICCVFATVKPNISKSAGARLKQATRKQGDYPLPRVLMIHQDYKLMLIMWPLSNLCGQPLMLFKKYLLLGQCQNCRLQVSFFSVSSSSPQKRNLAGQ